ncbi:flagellar assembly protein FliH [Shewanella litorisediminis]|uniref:Flagellar assembly protein FliH n=1 Tax=Shewanella litorisediminis TaxID=1173586 RepID=A0ABX7FZS1_9GAMM|nr:flagellar assembly protein FliH [Shewanella litorisediminis]MCL2919678.1 flagellar assembly protein FliH [Shewanella litorisediminis]QRH00565.1 flagellar assembly protein FliH [Shewanella litorisediminis]
MTDSKRPKNILRGEEQDEFAHWRLPDMSSAREEEPANLLGRRPGQTFVAEQEEEIRPPTLAEIEAIRAEAEQEGLAAGHAEGLAQGLEAGRLQGLKEGHEEGVRQGHEQGMAQGLEDAARLIARFEGLIEQFAAPMAVLDNEIEQELLSLAMGLAKQILQHELKTHPEHVLAALREGVDCLPLKEQQVKIRLNPEDVTLVSSLYGPDELTRKLWQLESDPLLARGELVIDSQRSRVDMRLENRIAAVLAAPIERHETLEREAQVLQQQLQGADTGRPNQTEVDGAEQEPGDDKSSPPSAE